MFFHFRIFFDGIFEGIYIAAKPRARKASVRGADHEVDGTKVEEEHVGISTASKRQLKSE